MSRCYYCKAKSVCSAAVEEGSIMCTLNRMRYGGTHEHDPEPNPCQNPAEVSE